MSRHYFRNAAILSALWSVAHAQELHFVRVSPRHAPYLELSDGRPFIPNGLNIPTPGGPRGGEMASMERWVELLAQQGGNLIRIWLAHPYWSPESSPGVFSDEAAQRLNTLLNICGARHVRVKITLDYFRQIDPARARHAWELRDTYHVSKDGPFEDMSAFWNTPTGRGLFLARLDWLAERFRHRPEIFGWELWNEINAAGGAAQEIQAWTEYMLAETKKRFPQHLVMQSLGSFDRSSSRETYRIYASMPGNELAQVHRYLDLGAALPICRGPMDVLASDAVRELQSFQPGRPILLAESGAVQPNHTGPFELYPRDHEGILLHDVLFAPFFSGSAGSGQCWHWHEYVDANKLWWHFGRFAKAVEGLNPINERLAPLPVVTNGTLRIYGLRGVHTFIAWCRDTRMDWREELQQKMTPQPTENASLSVPLPWSQCSGQSSVAIYDPWENIHMAGKIQSGHVHLPRFKRSVVMRITSP